jgi:hypothetical protein
MADVNYWRARLESSYPNGTFARYDFRSPKFLVRKFGLDAIEESQLAVEFARENLALQVLRQDQYNHILANKYSYSKLLTAALNSQSDLNKLIHTTPELNLNAAAAAVVMAPLAPITPGAPARGRGKTRSQRAAGGALLFQTGP